MLILLVECSLQPFFLFQTCLQTSNALFLSLVYLDVIAYYEEFEDIMAVDYVLPAGVQDPSLPGRRKRRGMFLFVFLCFMTGTLSQRRNENVCMVYGCMMMCMVVCMVLCVLSCT